MTLETASQRLQVDCLDSLSRLAAKFSNVKLQTINQISVSEITESSVQLQVVSCENDSCVSLLVPLEFPNRCNPDSADFDECVINNVYKLDESLVEISKKEEDYNQLDDSKRTSARFQIQVADDARIKPDWWQKPSGDLKRACADTRDILNSNSFETELFSLTTALIPYQGERVVAAKVDSICPRGMLLTALTNGQGALSLEFQFPRTVETPKMLHEVILGAVTQAQQQLQLQFQQHQHY